MDGGRLTAVVSDPPPLLSNLPADMLLEILKRLPAKTLMKFKCVSKYWFNLIRDPSFAESHFNHARTHRSDASHLLFACFFFSAEQIKTIFPANNDDLSLSSQLPSHTFGKDFQPCSNVVNGLICVCSVIFSGEPCVWVLNLTTTEKKALPVPPSLATAKTVPINLYCSSRFYLGFDPVSNKYKILHYHCEGAYAVLTLGISETWRQVQGSPAADVDLAKIREGFIFQGFGHGGMASINGRIYFRKVVDRVIAFFDLKEEKFRQVAAPQSIEGITCQTDIYLVDLGGKLALVVGMYELATQLRIWISEDDKDNNNWVWVEKRLTLPDLYFVEFIGITGGNNAKLILYCKDIPFSNRPTYFFCYDLKTMERITTTVIRMQPYMDPLFYNFVENIVPLDRIIRCEEPTASDD